MRTIKLTKEEWQWLQNALLYYAAQQIETRDRLQTANNQIAASAYETRTSKVKDLLVKVATTKEDITTAQSGTDFVS